MTRGAEERRPRLSASGNEIMGDDHSRRLEDGPGAYGGGDSGWGEVQNDYSYWRRGRWGQMEVINMPFLGKDKSNIRLWAVGEEEGGEGGAGADPNAARPLPKKSSMTCLSPLIIHFIMSETPASDVSSSFIFLWF